MAAETIHLRLPDQTREKLEKLAAATNRPRTYHINVALDRYLEEEIWQIGHIREGVADLDAGRARGGAAGPTEELLLTWLGATPAAITSSFSARAV